MKLISQIALLLLSASAAFGQTALATVTGTITDPTGAVVPNAPVSLKNVETGQVYAAASSGSGNYTVTRLPIGAYDLTVAAPGTLRLDFWNSFGTLRILSGREGEPDPPASVSEFLKV